MRPRGRLTGKQSANLSQSRCCNEGACAHTTGIAGKGAHVLIAESEDLPDGLSIKLLRAFDNRRRLVFGVRRNEVFVYMGKKIFLSRLLILLMLVSSAWGLAACGDTEQSQADSKDQAVAEEQAETESEQTAQTDKKEEKTASSEKQTQKSESKPASQPVQQTCSITIEGWGSKTVNYQSGDTVYSILQRSGAPIQVESSVYGIYIVGINGLKEGDKGAGSGWTYTVNGETIWASADKASVNPGDSISWSFVTNGF